MFRAAVLATLIIGLTLAVGAFLCFHFKKRYAMFAMIAALSGFSFSGRWHSELEAARSRVSKPVTAVYENVSVWVPGRE